MYKGMWKEGKQSGKGMFYNPISKKWREGVWKNGKRIQWNDTTNSNKV